MFENKLVLKTKTKGTAPSHSGFTGVVIAAVFFVMFSAPVSQAYNGPEAGMAASDKAPELKDIGIDEKLGKKIDFNTTFKDEYGKEVTLGSYFDGKHPVIISPVYFACPGLCNFHLNGL